MNVTQLVSALSAIKADIETAITSAQFNGRTYSDGQAAKAALIRSSRLIFRIHEVAKIALRDELDRLGKVFQVHPPLGQNGPELNVTGFIKQKDQDIVVLVNNTTLVREPVVNGPLIGETDEIGSVATGTSIVIGVRSQLSSVAKNFDTLMERAFAETLNLRLRLDTLTMGEIYLLPVVEYDDRAMLSNQVAFKNQNTPLEKFIRIFSAISGRSASDRLNIYKYERTALLLADFRHSPPRLVSTSADLSALNIDPAMVQAYTKLRPQNFAADLVACHLTRHGL